MAFEHKAGQLTLFKNDRKEKDTHPDYKGDGLDLQGKPVWISAWIKEGSKGKFMSLSIQPKQPKQQDDTPAPRQSQPAPHQSRQQANNQRAQVDLGDDLDNVPF